MTNIFNYKGSYPVNLESLIDIEYAFSKYNVLNKCFTDKALTNTILRYIDKTEIVDEYYLRNRFGKQIPIYAISTGAKAALLLAFIDNPDSYILDTKECGWNAIQAIILFCKNCNILTNYISKNEYHEFYRDIEICVKFDGQVFNSTYSLNEYVDEMEW